MNSYPTPGSENASWKSQTNANDPDMPGIKTNEIIPIPSAAPTKEATSGEAGSGSGAVVLLLIGVLVFGLAMAPVFMRRSEPTAEIWRTWILDETYASVVGLVSGVLVAALLSSVYIGTREGTKRSGFMPFVGFVFRAFLGLWTFVLVTFLVMRMYFRFAGWGGPGVNAFANKVPFGFDFVFGGARGDVAALIFVTTCVAWFVRCMYLSKK